MNAKPQKNQGFTLIEVAIVMLIGGLLTAALAAALTVYIQKTRLDVSKKRLEAIQEAVQTFVSQNGSYPCPARFLSPMDDANFGVAVPNCAGAAPGGTDDTVRTAGRATPAPARNVRIGSVPVRTLNLPDDFMADAWGNRFTYAVTEALTDNDTFDADEGGIFVIDSAGNNVIVHPAAGSGHYAIVSHGRNRSGAIPLSGGAAATCPPNNATNLDAENCNRDATFRNSILISEGTTQFDDLLRARAISPFGATIPTGAVMAFDLPACPQGWDAYGDADGRVIVGAASPSGDAVGATGGVNSAQLPLTELGYNVPTNVFIRSTAVATTAAGNYSFLRPEINPRAVHDNRQAYLALRYCVKR